MLHKNSLAGDQHYIQNWEVADVAARLALTVVAGDVGKLCRQLDTNVFYILMDDSPMTWETLGSSGEIQSVIMPVKNNTGVSIPAGSAVYVSGVAGSVAQITLAKADAEATSSKTIGLTRNTMANGASGFLVLEGRLVDVDTSAFAEGDVIFLSAATAGVWTTTRPAPPNHGVFLGYVIKAHATQGIISVKVQNGYELEELHNVNAGTPANGDTIVFNAATGTWDKFALITAFTSKQDADALLASIATLSFTGNAGLVLKVNAGETAFEFGAGGGGGGLTNFTDTINTSAPNATVPVVALTASNAATNVDVALIAKGTGAITAQIADSTATGGNKRGTNAIDWQKTRSAASSVASGTDAVVGGGNDNRASGVRTVVAGGASNIANATHSAVGGGSSNTASGNYSYVGGGYTNASSGIQSVIPGGGNNTVSGNYSAALGNSNTVTGVNSFSLGNSNTLDGNYSAVIGSYGILRARSALLVFSGGQGSPTGDTQWSRQNLKKTTTDATVSTMSANGTTSGSTEVTTLPNNGAYAFEGKVVARQNSTGDTSAWIISGLIKRGANAAATAIVGTPTITLLGQDAGAAAWVLALDADTSVGALRLRITGEAAKTIKWFASVEVCEVVS